MAVAHADLRGSDSNPKGAAVTCFVDAQQVEVIHAGPCGYTLRHRPWSVVVSVEFSEDGCESGRCQESRRGEQPTSSA
jgi:hypothetical protein